MKILLLFAAVWVSSAGSHVWAQAPGILSYQGYLESGSTPVNDAAASLTFRLFDDATAGNLLWTETHTGVAVTDGLFEVELGRVTPLTGFEFSGPLWLEVQENGGGTVLAPRTALTSAPYALGLHLPLLASAPVAGTAFAVNNSASSGDAIKGETNGQSGRGVVGQASAFVGPGYGVYGISYSAEGAGVYGLANTTVATDPNYGVYGQSNSDTGYGVYGRSTTNAGTAVYGRHESTGNYGALGRSVAGVFGSAAIGSGLAGYFEGQVYMSEHVAIGNVAAPVAALEVSYDEQIPLLRLYQQLANADPEIQISGAATDGSSPNLTWTIRTGFNNNEQFTIGVVSSDTPSLTHNMLRLRAPNTLGNPLAMHNGAFLSPGGVWTNASSADLKEGFALADGRAILETLSRLPVQTWQYTAEPGVRHIGPTAEDFRAAFSFGGSDKGIGTVDADGVTLAAIQALYELVQGQQAEIDRLRAEIDALRAGN